MGADAKIDLEKVPFPFLALLALPVSDLWVWAIALHGSDTRPF